MFRSTTEAPLLTEAGVMGLCVSLNSPVVNLDELPVGPARAALLLSAGDYGGLRIAVGLRSVETGTVAHFAYAGDVEEFATPRQAMDAALAFAERMGFLFDDDAVQTRGRAEALALWNELTGAHDAGIAEESDALELDLEVDPDDDAELLLDEFARGSDEPVEVGEPGDGLEAIVEDEDLLPEVALEVADEPVEPVPVVAPAESSSAPSLTKFRKAPAAPTARERSGEESGGNALGRIPLIRRRLVAEPARPPRPGFLMRILSGF